MRKFQNLRAKVARPEEGQAACSCKEWPSASSVMMLRVSSSNGSGLYLLHRMKTASAWRAWQRLRSCVR
jgi:hypothetical protein